MNSTSPLKHVVLAFVISLVGYVAIYYGIEHRRTFRGPWRVTFTNTAAGMPELIVNQPQLGIANLRIDFPNDKLPPTNSSGLMIFDTPKPWPYPVPFGQCLFMDTTFQPGTVTFKLFDHEIELLPRVLIIDRKETPWKSEDVILLSGAGVLQGVPAK